MVTALQRDVVQAAEAVLEPEGFKVKITTGKKHHFIVVEKAEAVVGRISFSTSPRSNNSANWMRQKCQRWLKERRE